ncbi:hypothetical protein HBH47_203750 [Parastagonospora nodorum]|nr:hypothetical protein HBH47_203750 [Parastagonospora nodorum]
MHCPYQIPPPSSPTPQYPSSRADTQQVVYGISRRAQQPLTHADNVASRVKPYNALVYANRSGGHTALRSANPGRLSAATTTQRRIRTLKRELSPDPSSTTEDEKRIRLATDPLPAPLPAVSTLSDLVPALRRFTRSSFPRDRPIPQILQESFPLSRKPHANQNQPQRRLTFAKYRSHLPPRAPPQSRRLASATTPLGPSADR